jgi:hypothetical protein
MAKFVTAYYEQSHGKPPEGFGEWGFVGLYGVNEFGWVSDQTYVLVDGVMLLDEAMEELVQDYPSVGAWAVAP